MNATNKHRAVEDGCVREGLIAEAKATGIRFRNAVRRGDFSTADHAWETGDHGVGYPYMTAPEAAAARSAFIRALRDCRVR